MSTDKPPTEHEPEQTNLEVLRARLAAATDWLRGFFYGMTMYEQVLTLRKQRADLEHLFVLISFGDLLGVPVLPPYYTLRLLPYIVPLIRNWRFRMLREKDLTDLTIGG
jgi:hypothetical protein